MTEFRKGDRVEIRGYADTWDGIGTARSVDDVSVTVDFDDDSRPTWAQSGTFLFEDVTFLKSAIVDTEQSIATGVFVVVGREYEDTIVQAFGTALDALKAVNGEQYYRAYFMPYGAYKGWEDIK